MKKLFAMAVIAALLLGLLGCQASGRKDNGEGGPGADLGSDDQPYGVEDVAFLAQYIRTNGYLEGAKFPWVVILRSVEELNAYYEANRDTFDLERKDQVYADTTIGFLDACDRYDAAFFEKQVLVMVLLEEGSGSVRHEVTDVVKSEDGKLYISIRDIVPEIGTDDMAEWHILIEMDKTYDVEKLADVFLNGKCPEEEVEIGITGQEQIYVEKERGEQGITLYLRMDSKEFTAGHAQGSFRFEGDRLILDGGGRETVFAVEGDDLICQKSGESDLFYDGMILSPEKPRQETGLDVPPDLKLIVDGNSAYAIRGGYTWQRHYEDGTSAAVIADSVGFPEVLELDGVVPFAVTDSAGTLEFSTDPDSFTVQAWNCDSGECEAVELVGYEITLKAGCYLYEVMAKWDGKGYEGAATYFLYVTLTEK